MRMGHLPRCVVTPRWVLATAAVVVGCSAPGGVPDGQGAAATTRDAGDGVERGGAAATDAAGTTSRTAGGYARVALSTEPWRTAGEVQITAAAGRTRDEVVQPLECSPRRTVGACTREDCKLAAPVATAPRHLALGALTLALGNAPPRALTPNAPNTGLAWSGADALHLRAASAEVPGFAVDIAAPSKILAWRRDLGADSPIQDGVVVLPKLEAALGLPTSWVLRGEASGTIETRIAAEIPGGSATVSCKFPAAARESRFPPELLEGLQGGILILYAQAEATTRVPADDGNALDVDVIVEEYVADVRFSLR